ncbi:flagellar motor protein MotB [Gluconacetobacter johannae DSM 13595]|uniref:Chemotaxis protein MotB n=1 Tax=Gluconacetobacter johannae TaxID=112140 RepID=A0A7W4J9S7_9PROT|nr:flagellar motor protein MotB [Gluconacetobacter johannae]MBB2177305.1 chemotaxis protein MotB [Gluconacetobacter johannae]GBQ82594.1 flagellar motor protein MotB [Gluconacetobacter johannae DSM 13595]
MAKNDNRPIIIRRDDTDTESRHGGAWKIAYGDFMTALMAFFLVMWLLNATTDEQRQGIAQFFNPMAEQGAHLQATDAMLDAQPSPLTGGTSVRRVQDGETSETEQNENPEAQGFPRIAPRGGSADDMAPGIATDLTPSPLAIVPIGGPQSGAAKGVGYIGANNTTDAAAEQASIAQMAAGLQKAVEQSPVLRDAASNMSVRVERDDIRIELRDANNSSMFDPGAATANRLGNQMLAEIGRWLAPLPERISIIGYTDGAPYRTVQKGSMSNWTLSALRADDARKILVRSGYPDRNILDVSGHADRDLAIPSDPAAAGNRRVVIILHRRYPSPTDPTAAAPAAAGAGSVTPASPTPSDGTAGPGTPKQMAPKQTAPH